MLPGTNRILVQPAPQGAVADRRDQAVVASISRQLRHAPTSQRLLALERQFAGQGLNLHDQLWGGEKPGPARSWYFLQSGQSLGKEAFSPPADNFPGLIQP